MLLIFALFEADNGISDLELRNIAYYGVFNNAFVILKFFVSKIFVH